MAGSRGEVKKRWIRCLIWQQVVGTIIWITWNTALALTVSSDGPTLSSFGIGFLRFLVFQMCMTLLLVGHFIVTSPEEKAAAGVWEIMVGFMGAVIGGRDEATCLRRRTQTLADWALFVFITTFVGFLALFSLAVGLMSPFDTILRGAALGFVYGLHYIYKRRWVLCFPIIQRPLFFSLKMGIPSAATRALKLSLIALPCATTLIFFLHSRFRINDNGNGFLSSQTVFFLASYPIVFCWELIHHLIQVVHTRRYVFAPPHGSAAAETNPTDQLLVALEENSERSLAQYLAYLDLCMVSENNVDSWRRAAFFEETGETYKRIISACLGPLEQMVIRLRESLDGTSLDKKSDVLSHQMHLPTDYPVQENVKEAFTDLQLCSWCARTVASLTSSSHEEDRFGVAQLSGCNGVVVSTLLSCLLIVEVYLGKRSNIQPMHLMGPASIRWNLPSRGGVIEVGKKQGLASKKKTILRKKAYAMADVLRLAIYQIISVFQDEMLL
ncbi:hypothetical protein KI387_016587, partial [Taxus chinensis]